MGTLVSVLIVVLVFGLIWWGVSQLPMAPAARAAASAIVIVIAVVVLLSLLPVGNPLRLGACP